MGIRSFVTLEVLLGLDNSVDGDLAARAELEELLDTLANASSQVGSLEAGEQNVRVAQGDVSTVRLVWVEAEGDIDLYFGGVAATSASRTGAAGTFPTLFAGTETLALAVDGVSFTVAFQAGDQAIAAVVNRVNAAAAFAGLDGLVASNAGGQLKVASRTAGSSSSVAVTAGAAATTLGLAAGTTLGTAPTANTSPVSLRRLADAASSQVEALKSYALLTVQTTSLYVSNPSLTDDVSYRIVMAGDLVATPC